MPAMSYYAVCISEAPTMHPIITQSLPNDAACNRKAVTDPRALLAVGTDARGEPRDRGARLQHRRRAQDVSVDSMRPQVVRLLGGGVARVQPGTVQGSHAEARRVRL